MELDDLTIGQAKALASMFDKEAPLPASSHIGKQCVIRTYASGVHFGILKSQSGRSVELTNARRLWKWHALEGISLSEVAQIGIDPSKSRICCTVPEISITDALEIIPASEGASSSIKNAPVASK